MANRNPKNVGRLKVRPLGLPKGFTNIAGGGQTRADWVNGIQIFENQISNDFGDPRPKLDIKKWEGNNPGARAPKKTMKTKPFSTRRYEEMLKDRPTLEQKKDVAWRQNTWDERTNKPGKLAKPVKMKLKGARGWASKVPKALPKMSKAFLRGGLGIRGGGVRGAVGTAIGLGLLAWDVHSAVASVRQEKPVSKGAMVKTKHRRKK